MWGYEGEELEDIEATIRHVSTSQPDIFFTTISYPIKGTPYYNKISDRLVQLQTWAKTSDRELKVKGRHTKSFYVYADKLLRDEVTRAKLLQNNRGDELPELEVLEQNIHEWRAGLQSTYYEIEQ